MADGTRHDEVLAAWRAVPAALLAGLPADGDVVKRTVLHPAILQQLGPVDGLHVVDVGCGTGELAVLLAEQGARVTALEPSPALAAHTRDAAARRGVPLQVVEDDLLTAAPLAADAVVASLVLCGIPDLDAAIAGCLRLLRARGLLVLAVEHPCFEQDLRSWTRTGRAVITRYLGEFEVEGSIAPDFHRPLSTYVTALLRAGCQVVEFAEPAAAQSVLAEHPYLQPLRELPLFLVVAVRGPAGDAAESVSM